MLLAALIWGLGFIAQILGARHLAPLSFTGFRFALAALLIAPFVVRGRPSRDDVVGGLVAGSVMAVAAVLQQWGMGATTAANGGFITSTYVLIAPFLAAIAGHRVRWPVWCGVAMVLPGLWLLSIEGDFVVRDGDPMVLACALGWAVHILLTGHWAGRVNAANFAGIQFAVTGAAALAIGLPLERPSAEAVVAAAGAIGFSAVFPTVVAFTLQAVAQRVAPPAHSAILLSLEAVFAMIAGAVLLHEEVTGRKVLGAALMFVGMLVAQRRVADPASRPGGDGVGVGQAPEARHEPAVETRAEAGAGE